MTEHEWTELDMNAREVCVVHDRVESVAWQLKYRDSYFRVCAEIGDGGIHPVQRIMNQRARMLESEIEGIKAAYETLRRNWPPMADPS